ncbi:MAG: hypothetical protein WBO92_03360 [Candidatus Moraniibacteriota bacterium]
METKKLTLQTASDKRPALERIALAAPRYIGSPLSLVLHSIFFVGIFVLQWTGYSFEEIMLILTTVVSLEAIYLSIFIQITVNHQAMKLTEVSEDVDEISEDVEEIGEDVEGISEDVEEISKGLDDIQEDVKEISEEVEDLGEEIEKDDQEYSADRSHDIQKITHIQTALEELLREVKAMKEDR